ncbi:acyl carrier protein [Clostridiales Family XIII bacterium PM5-7]
MSESVFQLIETIVSNVTGKSGLTLDTDFVQDLGLSSFDIMNIICAFEERFDMEISTRDVWQLHRVQDVITYMEEKGIKEV